jgi:hypothetical protein
MTNIDGNIASSAPATRSASKHSKRHSVSSLDFDSDDGSAIRAEALKMIELADDHLKNPHSSSVRKTASLRSISSPKAGNNVRVPPPPPPPPADKNNTNDNNNDNGEAFLGSISHLALSFTNTDSTHLSIVDETSEQVLEFDPSNTSNQSFQMRSEHRRGSPNNNPPGEGSQMSSFSAGNM